MRFSTRDTLLHASFFSRSCFLTILLAVFVMHGYSQTHHYSKRELRKLRIDSVFTKADADSLDTRGLLRYEYFFVNGSDGQLQKLSARLERDSFEPIFLETKDGKEWRMGMTKNEIHSRESMLVTDKRMNALAYRFIINRYEGFSISETRVNPMKVPDEKFSAYLHSLDNESLFSAANYLFRKASYNRSVLAFEESINRHFKEDTSHYQIGNALMTTNELVYGIEHWEAARNLNPMYLDAYLKLGEIFYENAHYNRSLYNFMKADTIDPDNDQILYHLSETLYQLRRYDESYVYAKRSLKLNRKNVFAKGMLHLLNEPAIRKMRKQAGVMGIQ